MQIDLRKEFNNLIDVLNYFERSHKEVCKFASENDDWQVVNRESAIIPKIIRWSKQLEELRDEILESGLIVNIYTKKPESEVVDPPSVIAEPILLDEQPFDRYVWEKMHDLSSAGHLFSEREIIELQDAEWSQSKLNLPCSFFQKKREPEHSYWMDSLSFNETDFYLCMLWNENKECERSQRQLFDFWYNQVIDESIAGFSSVDTFQPYGKPFSLFLFGKKYHVCAWNDLYIKVCEVLLLHRPYVISALDHDEDFNTNRRTHFSYIQSEIKFRKKRLSNGLWIETNQNAAETLRKCRCLLEKCGYSPEELRVETVEE